ncbi:MAG: HEAT repeat domain-containing protein [Haloarcula sp.]
MSDQPPAVDRLVTLVIEEPTSDAIACLERFGETSAEDRKAAMQALRTVAADRSVTLDSLCPALVQYLKDDERAVRLSTAKLLAVIAESDPDSVIPMISALADRLADDDEFYYVRARVAETLGYIAVEYPEKVTSPETLADLRIGLAFDEPEVREKLSKALEYIALGAPHRLRHQVSALADHLDDENELVRYHLTSALVVVGCEFPERLTAARDDLVRRLTDDNDHVRGRAAEALGLLARTGSDESTPAESSIRELVETQEEDSFASRRAHFALNAISSSATSRNPPGTVGTLEGVRDTTGDAVDAITSPDSDGECPHCGLTLPGEGPPMCPQCGAPY